MSIGVGNRPSLFLRLRFWTAAAAVGVMNLNVLGFSFKKLCTFGFNCHGCPWASFSCPVGVLTFGSAIRVLPALALSGVMAVGVLTGRLVCGFACPFGWFQDLLHRLPGPKWRLPRWTRWLRYAALVLLVFVFPFLLGFEQSGYLRLDEPEVAEGADGQLAVTVSGENLGTKPVRGVNLVLGYFGRQDGNRVFQGDAPYPAVVVAPGARFTLPVAKIPDMRETADLQVTTKESVVEQVPRYQLYFCRICPNGTLTASLLPRWSGGDTAGMYRGGWLSFRYLVLFAFLALMVVVCRPFCRMLCPLGAMYGLLAPLAVLGFRVDRERCTDCGLCDKNCPVDLDVRREIGGPDCIACGDCVRRCPHACLRRCFLPGGGTGANRKGAAGAAP